MGDWMNDLNQPVRSISGNDAPRDPTCWPFTIPAIAQLLTEPLDLGPCTVLVGDNGSGKSTVIEAIAQVYGLNAEGGSTGARHATRRSESALADHLTLLRGATASRWGYFFRAETMHGLFTYLEQVAVSPGLHELSHGEAFREIIATRCYTPDGDPKPGLYLFDEVESALSFSSSLQVLAMFTELSRTEGVQLLLATHSPVLAAIPGARILQFDADGITPRQWADLDLVIGERHFLADPRSFLRHLD